MSKKIKIILIAIFIIILLLIGFYFYNKSRGIPVGNPNISVYQKFNPFGSASNITNSIINNTNNPTTNNGVVSQNSRFHKLTNFAVSGAAYFEDLKPSLDATTPIVNNSILPNTNKPYFESIPSIRYAERSTGHIYQMTLSDKKSGVVSNSTIPGVYEVIFNDKADSAIYRYISPDETNITSFLASLGGSSNFLAPDILAVSLSPDKSQFFSLIKSKDGVIGTIKSFSDTKTAQVFTSPFSEWIPQWIADKSIYLTTKPSYLAEGFVFELNTSNGTLTKLFGNIMGLTTLSNNGGSLVLYNTTVNTGPRLNIFNIKDNSSFDLNLYGLPEKCIWSNDNINIYCAIPNTIVGNQYPDDWYKGLISFDDKFVKINTTTKNITMIANSSSETPVDGTNMFLNKNETSLFFINKKDSTLWSLDL